MDARSRRMLPSQLCPSRNQLFVDRIELVAAGFHLLEPVPLHDRGFEQRSRRISVVFEQFRRRGAVIGQIEPAVDIGIAPPPRVGDPLMIGFRDLHVREIAGSHDTVDRLEAEPMECLGRLLDQVDLGRGEDVARPFPPIRPPVGCMKIEAERLDLRLPIRTGVQGIALHGPT
jgi:hypothetical protein